MQDFHVLKCFSCNVYQVHIVKKSSKKWACKMCGEKQSIIKVFGQGSAKDCREHVQKLNMIRGQSLDQEDVPSHGDYEDYQSSRREEQDDQFYDQDPQSKEGDQQFSKEEESHSCSNPSNKSYKAPPVSKWACFLDPEQDE